MENHSTERDTRSAPSDELTAENLRLISKYDLHVHLNGAIPTGLAKELLEPIKHELPEGFDLERDLQVLKPVGNLQEYFRPWLGLKQLPRGRDCLKKMVFGALSLLRKDNVEYVELRNSPFNIAQLNGILLPEALEWLVDILIDATTKLGISAVLVLSVSRYNFSLERAHELLDAIKITNPKEYVVALDLSGNEDSPISDGVSKTFCKAKDDLGLGITVHAGETGNIKNIEWAINSCKADRIAHGLAASQSQKMMDMLRERDICLEICLSTNLKTRSVETIDLHPILNFIQFGVPFVLCSDNPAINGSLLSDEYALFGKTTGRYDIVSDMKTMQMRYAFRR